jgi:hypothetical protein
MRRRGGSTNGHRKRRVLAAGTAAALSLPLCLLTFQPASDPVGGGAPALNPKCQEAPSAGVITVDCVPGWSTQHDRIKIYPRGNPGPAASSDESRFADAVWVFDVAARRQASIIIDFHPLSGSLVADLFDDGNGDGAVDYVVREGVPTVLENGGKPTIRVVSRDGWWQRDGRTSFNLDLLVDGPVRASFSSSAFWPLGLLRTDGRVDFEIHVRDRDHDGDPEDDWRQDYPPLSEDPRISGYYRTHIMSNPEGDEVPIMGSLFWPYLGSTMVGDFVKGYGVSKPPIGVDWKRAKIVQVGEFVASRGNPGNFFIYSLNRVHPEETTATNFENPFAFYDLAKRNDGWPDMTIRFEATLPNEVSEMPNPEPINIVEWSWDQQHAHQWNYALNLVGSQRVDETIRFPEFSVRAIPPDRLPNWISDQTWQAATFVEVLKPYWTSERVYEYTVEEGGKVLPLRYLTGLDPEPPTSVFDSVPEGFRGEYSFDLSGQARLYLSPVDRRLHLVNASHGKWNIGGARELRYGSLGGRFVDQWSLYDAGQRLETLSVVSGRVIYTGPDGTYVGLAKTGEAPATFPPPRNHAEWVRLRALLKSVQPKFEPDDLHAMFESVATSVERLPGVLLRDVKLTGDGFESIAKIGARPGNASWLKSVVPGDYVLRYRRDSGYALDGVRPPELHTGKLTVQPEPRALQPVHISVGIHNSGDGDASRAVVSFIAVGDDNQDVVLDSAVVDVPGRGTTVARATWIPPHGGEWKIRTSVNGRAASSARVEIANTPEADLPRLLALQGIPPGIFWLGLVLLVMTGVVAGATAVSVWHSNALMPPGPGDEASSHG